MVHQKIEEKISDEDLQTVSNFAAMIKSKKEKELKDLLFALAKYESTLENG